VTWQVFHAGRAGSNYSFDFEMASLIPDPSGQKDVLKEPRYPPAVGAIGESAHGELTAAARTRPASCRVRARTHQCFWLAVHHVRSHFITSRDPATAGYHGSLEAAS
jgi:hypothetical protein